MPRKKHNAEEIIRKLRQAEVWLGEALKSLHENSRVGRGLVAILYFTVVS